MFNLKIVIIALYIVVIGILTCIDRLSSVSLTLPLVSNGGDRQPVESGYPCGYRPPGGRRKYIARRYGGRGKRLIRRRRTVLIESTQANPWLGPITNRLDHTPLPVPTPIIRFAFGYFRQETTDRTTPTERTRPSSSVHSYNNIGT
jgi:hypothetical protein